MRIAIFAAALVFLVLLSAGVFLVRQPERVDDLKVALPFLARGGADAPKPSPIAAVPVTSSSGDSPRPELVRFLDEEAKVFESPKQDTLAAERRLEAQAENLGPSDLAYLTGKALTMDTRASDRILAAYLLVAAKEKGWNSLRELVLAPLEGNPTPTPHSVDEVRSMQEKSIRIMAIDGLFEQAQRSVEARDRFFRIVEEIRDPTLARYAQKRARELRGM